MRDYLPELIAIYARVTTADVKSDPAYQTLCNSPKEDPGAFDRARCLVDESKKRLETILNKPMGRHQQVRAALIELRKQRDHRHCPIFEGLIEQGYKPHWTDEQKKYFDRAWQVIQTKKTDFFFSFTARHMPEDVENTVNPDYKYFIIDRLGPVKYETADRAKANLLAKSVHAWLIRDTFKGFVFTEDQYDNSVTMEKLQDALNQALVFVQMVQRIMFDEPEKPPNYCLWEYEEARNSILSDPDGEKRILFIVADESRANLPKVEDVPAGYEEWCKHLLSKDPPFLMRFTGPSDARIEEFKRLLDKRIREQIRAAREGIVDGVPPGGPDVV